MKAKKIMTVISIIAIMSSCAVSSKAMKANIQPNSEQKTAQVLQDQKQEILKQIQLQLKMETKQMQEKIKKEIQEYQLFQTYVPKEVQKRVLPYAQDMQRQKTLEALQRFQSIHTQELPEKILAILKQQILPQLPEQEMLQEKYQHLQMFQLIEIKQTLRKEQALQTQQVLQTLKTLQEEQALKIQ